MTQIEAVFESGVFRPIEPIQLPEQTRVQVSVPNEKERARLAVLEILSRRFESGVADTAARHDEHQP